MSSAISIIKTTIEDNVAIVVNEAGLPKGTVVHDSIELLEAIPFGHKVALSNLAIGDPIIRYGQAIGYANQIINQGEWINENKMSLPTPPEIPHHYTNFLCPDATRLSVI